MYTLDYDRYIRSDRWRAKRVAALAHYGPSCQACQSTRRLHVHHRTYTRFGSELVADLRILCEICHTVVHQLERDNGVALGKATDLVVDHHGVARDRQGDRYSTGPATFAAPDDHPATFATSGRTRYAELSDSDVVRTIRRRRMSVWRNVDVPARTLTPELSALGERYGSHRR